MPLSNLILPVPDTDFRGFLDEVKELARFAPKIIEAIEKDLDAGLRQDSIQHKHFTASRLRRHRPTKHAVKAVDRIDQHLAFQRYVHAQEKYPDSEIDELTSMFGRGHAHHRYLA